jgi:hypothetical protein
VAEPEPVPPPEPAPADVPSIATTLEIPPNKPIPAEGEVTAGMGGEAGGEWDVLMAKVKDWFANGELLQLWERWRDPLRLLLLVIGLVLLLRLYGSVVGTIDSIPLFGGLLELVGLLSLVRFSLTHLVRAEQREQVLSDWQRRWKDFRGRF